MLNVSTAVGSGQQELEELFRSTQIKYVPFGARLPDVDEKHELVGDCLEYRMEDGWTFIFIGYADWTWWAPDGSRYGVASGKMFHSVTINNEQGPDEPGWPI